MDGSQGRITRQKPIGSPSLPCLVLPTVGSVPRSFLAPSCRVRSRLPRAAAAAAAARRRQRPRQTDDRCAAPDECVARRSSSVVCRPLDLRSAPLRSVGDDPQRPLAGKIPRPLGTCTMSRPWSMPTVLPYTHTQDSVRTRRGTRFGDIRRSAVRRANVGSPMSDGLTSSTSVNVSPHLTTVRTPRSFECDRTSKIQFPIC
jgi:hypothetical protein